VGFACSVCGEYHAEELRDIRMGLPGPIFALSDEERAARAWLADDFAVLDDERFFVRGLLELPVRDDGGRFGYGTWVEVPVRTFRKLMKRWNDPNQFTPASCRLANDLPPYEHTVGLQATLQPVAPTRLPLVELDDARHRLVDEQRSGITSERSRELAAVVAHT
jgi:hypothetical protein